MSDILLVKNISKLVTMDINERELDNAAMLIEGNIIKQIGTTAELDSKLANRAHQVIDLKNHIVMPGMVNTHHHFYQTLTRAVKPDGSLFPWLRALYPIWANMHSDDIYISAQLAAAELMLSGCTTTSDHLYILPNDCSIDDEIRALDNIGMRFTAVRGSMSVGESNGGLAPDSIVEKEADILIDSQRLIDDYHDNSRHSMLRIALGPCSPFTISENLMRESALLAKDYEGVRLHTHLAENNDDIAYMQQVYKKQPAQWLESIGWLNDLSWHAHCVYLDNTEIEAFARSGSGVAHCPCSNMRLASGAAPIRYMLNSGVSVGLGVDGSASNDTSHMLQEARQAMLLARVREIDVDAMSARQALKLATVGGAQVLGRDDIGSLAVGMSADFIAFNIEQNSLVGAHADPVSALVLCHIDRVDYSYINGVCVVDKGRLTTVDYNQLAQKARTAAIRLSTS